MQGRGAWMVGQVNERGEFVVEHHGEVEASKGWHVRRSGSHTTVCGLAVHPRSREYFELYTVCWACASALSRSGQAVFVPWSVIEMVERVYWAQHRRVPV
jgi:hypothetical protein